MATPKDAQSCAVEALGNMLKLLGQEAEIEDKPDDEGLAFHLKTADAGRLIGRKGHYLQSLELVLNRIVRRQVLKSPWIRLDVDGYQRKSRSGRRSGSSGTGQALEEKALAAAKQVKRWGEPRVLGPLSLSERRVVHLALKDDDEVDTFSDDTSQGRKTVTVRLAAGAAADDASDD